MPVARPLLIAAGACLAVTAPVTAPCANLAFAQNFLTGSKQVVSFPVDDAGSMTVLGPQLDTMIGMDFDPGTDVLWAIDLPTHALGTLNQATGAFVPTVVLPDTNINAFTVDPADGTFYVSKGDSYIYRLDPLSGETTVLGLGAAADTSIRALAADCSGRVFALAGNGTDLNVLFEARPGVSGPISVGSTSYTGATSLEFDNQTGVLYAWFNASAALTSTYATIDTSTGASLPNTVADGKYRMAIRAECSIFADDFEA